MVGVSFAREFKMEAVRLVRDRGVSVAQACRDIGVHENVLRKWLRSFDDDPGRAFPGHSVMKPEQAEIERLRREVQKLKAKRDIIKKAAALLLACRCGFENRHFAMTDRVGVAVPVFDRRQT